MIELTTNMCDEGCLTCPDCGPERSYLHHNIVQVFSRPKEDAPGNIICIPNGLDPIVSVTPFDDFRRGRRGAVEIYFACECGFFGCLVLMQQKGHTYLHWEKSASTQPQAQPK